MKKSIDIDKLRECAESGMAQLDMAMIFDVSCSTIYACMKENGIKSTAHKPSKYNRELLIKYLQQGMSKERIAEIFNVNPETVRSWIRRNHLEEYQKPQKKLRKDDCKTCAYRERASGTAGKCNYLSITGHSRNKGQPEEFCSKYERSKRRKK